jgi:hypothetical protein
MNLLVFQFENHLFKTKDKDTITKLANKWLENGLELKILYLEAN